MTLNEVNIIKNSVLDATEAYVDARLNSSDFVKTQIGVTSGNAVVGSDGKYRHTVICNRTTNSRGVTYNNVLSVGNISFPSGSVVFMIIPNAQASNQFILGKLDTSPCNIEGGEIHIGKIGDTNEYYFNVNSTGNVTIKGVDSSIQLAQDGNTNYYHVNLDKNGIKLGHVANNNYNFVVDATTGKLTMKKGSITLGNAFKVDETGWLSIGGITNSAPFYVSNAGQVTIKNGSILLGETSSGSGYYNVNVNNTGLKLGYNRLRPNSYNFTVDTSGNMNMYQGSINLGTSTSTTSGCAFYVNTNGYLESVSGKIGGFNIASDHLYSEGNSAVSIRQNRIGVGYAGNGMINLVAGTSSNREDEYIQLSNSGSYDSCLTGIRIYGSYRDDDDVLRGVIQVFNSSGHRDYTKYVSNIPDDSVEAIVRQLITADPDTGYLVWS